MFQDDLSEPECNHDQQGQHHNHDGGELGVDDEHEHGCCGDIDDGPGHVEDAQVSRSASLSVSEPSRDMIQPTGVWLK